MDPNSFLTSTDVCRGSMQLLGFDIGLNWKVRRGSFIGKACIGHSRKGSRPRELGRIDDIEPHYLRLAKLTAQLGGDDDMSETDLSDT